MAKKSANCTMEQSRDSISSMPSMGGRGRVPLSSSSLIICLILGTRPRSEIAILLRVFLIICAVSTARSDWIPGDFCSTSE